MSDPDELYTLRAQYWLGHYPMAMEECKAVARRPMSPALKSEREEFLARSYIATRQYDKVSGMSQESPGKMKEDGCCTVNFVETKKNVFPPFNPLFSPLLALLYSLSIFYFNSSSSLESQGPVRSGLGCPG